MGYTTDFEGSLALTPPLSPEQTAYLQALNRTRRMRRNPEKLTIPDPIREAVGLPLGHQCEFFVGSTNNFGQDRDPSIISYNHPPESQPGLWCGWTTRFGNTIEWDGAEKFYCYVTWLRYIIDNMLVKWGIVANGAIKWQGEDAADKGKITVTNNTVEVEAMAPNCSEP